MLKNILNKIPGRTRQAIVPSPAQPTTESTTEIPEPLEIEPEEAEKFPARKLLAAVPQRFPIEHGYQIYTYVNARTRQTIYSLQKELTPQHLKQLTFVGKKSVPPTLRKDMWSPLCVLNFPNRFQGLHAYARLREFKLRHETEWDIEDFTWKEGPNAGQRMGSRESGKRRRSMAKSFKLMDQKANSIADMAAVLEIQSRPPEAEDVLKYEKMVHRSDIMSKTKQDGSTKLVPRARARYGTQSMIGHRVFEFQGKIAGTSIWWKDPHDAAHAQSWPEEVVHATLPVTRAREQGLEWPPVARVNIDVPAGTQAEQDATLAEKIEEIRAKMAVAEPEPYARRLKKGEKLTTEERKELLKTTREKIADAKERMVGELSPKEKAEGEERLSQVLAQESLGVSKPEQVTV